MFNFGVMYQEEAMHNGATNTIMLYFLQATTNTQSLVHKNADVKDSVLVLQSEETPLLIQLKKLHSNLKDVEVIITHDKYC